MRTLYENLYSKLGVLRKIIITWALGTESSSRSESVGSLKILDKNYVVNLFLDVCLPWQGSSNLLNSKFLAWGRTLNFLLSLLVSIQVWWKQSFRRVIIFLEYLKSITKFCVTRKWIRFLACGNLFSRSPETPVRW